MRLWITTLVLLASAGIAGAQPGAPAPEPVPPPPPADSMPPPPPADPAQAAFDAAFDAMTRGDFAGAEVGFRTVAQTAVDPELRGAARELGRLAADYARRGGRLSFGGTPGGTGALTLGGGEVDEGGVSEDDKADGGRTSFIITTTIASLYTGVVAIDLLDIGDVRAGTALVLGSTAAGLIGSLYGTRGRRMTGGMADAWSFGLGVGVGNALFLSSPLGLFDGDNADKKVLSFVLAGAWGGAAAGLIAADRVQPTRAQVSVVSTISVMSLASTLLGLAIVQPSELDGDAFLTISAAGLDVGVGVGAAFAGKLDWSLSRARLVGLSAFLGALAGGGASILLFADSGNDNTARLGAGITLAGLWGGFALGTRLTREMKPDYRFRNRRPAGTQAMLTPTIVHRSPGLAVTGTF